MDFLETAIRRNPNMIKAAARLHKSGEIPVNTYLIDLDTVRRNAEIVKNEVNKAHLTAYLCAKQVGRNPLFCRVVIDAGIQKAIAMDIEGMKIFRGYGIPVAHVGHFGQIPTDEIPYVLQDIQPDVITVLSFDKARQISDCARKIGKTQDLLIKVVGNTDYVTNPVPGGFTPEESIGMVRAINGLKGVKVVGVTTYPACSFDIRSHDYSVSSNFTKMMTAASRLKSELGLEIRQVNAAGRNCARTMAMLAENGATHVEPGHAFTGTLPDMAFYDAPEIPAVCYVTEISHVAGDLPQAFADSMMTTAMIGSVKNVTDYEYIYAIVGPDPDKIFQNKVRVVPQRYWHNDAAWQMYCTLLPDGDAKVSVGDTVIAGFRPQIYRAPGSPKVAVVAGIQQKKPRLAGLFTRSGLLIDRQSEHPVGVDTSVARKLMDSL